MKFAFLLLLSIACPALSQAQATFACPAGYEDMLNYFVMAYPARIDNYMAPGNANPIYTSIDPDYARSGYSPSGYFVWTKSLAGYPWDIKSFDTQYVYDRATELGWDDPTSFKRFDTDLPMSARCVHKSLSGGSIRIPASGTTYHSFSQCESLQQQPLGNVVNSISAPVSVYLNSLGTVKTRYFTYKYTCNQNYNSCQYEEVYSLGYGIGLYDWKFYVNQNGKFVLQSESVIDNYSGGQTTPSLPCLDSYQ